MYGLELAVCDDIGDKSRFRLSLYLRKLGARTNERRSLGCSIDRAATSTIHTDQSRFTSIVYLFSAGGVSIVSSEEKKEMSSTMYAKLIYRKLDWGYRDGRERGCLQEQHFERWGKEKLRSR